MDRRREFSRRLREQKKQRIAMALMGLLLLLILGIIVAGYVMIFVLPPRQLVVRVNDVRYTRGDMVKLLRVQQRGAEFFGQQFSAGTEVFQALNTIVENEIISQSAPKYGIIVPDQELDEYIRALLAPPQDDSADPVQAEREFRERYRAYLNTIQLSEQEHRQLVRKSLTREKLRQVIGESVPSVAPQVHLNRLIMTPEGEIDIMKIKFKDTVATKQTDDERREAFKALVREFSADNPEVIRKGGDLGWVPRGVYNDYDHVIFDLEVGKLSDPVPSVDNPRQLIFFMVSDRQEAREVEPEDRDALKTRALQEWINNERNSNDVYAVFNSDIYSWIIKQLGISSTITPTATRPSLFGF